MKVQKNGKSFAPSKYLADGYATYSIPLLHD